MWDVFFLGNGDEDLALSSFSHCKLNYYVFYGVHQLYNVMLYNVSLKQEKLNDTLLPLYIFLNAMHLNIKAKGQFHMGN